MIKEIHVLENTHIDDFKRLSNAMEKVVRSIYPPTIYKFEHNGKLRNKSCPCGSDKKFKQCCWDVLGEQS